MSCYPSVLVTRPRIPIHHVHLMRPQQDVVRPAVTWIAVLVPDLDVLVESGIAELLVCRQLMSDHPNTALISRQPWQAHRKAWVRSSKTASPRQAEQLPRRASDLAFLCHAVPARVGMLRPVNSLRCPGGHGARLEPPRDIGLAGGTRTRDLLHPKQARCQTAPQPDRGQGGGLRPRGLRVPNAALYQAELHPDVESGGSAVDAYARTTTLSRGRAAGRGVEKVRMGGVSGGTCTLITRATAARSTA